MITFAELLLTCLVLWIIYRYVISSKEKAPTLQGATGRGRHSAYQHRGWIALALILAVCLPMPVILRLMMVGGTIVLLLVVCAAIGRHRQTSSVATSGDPPRPAPKAPKLRRFERVKPIEPEYPESRSGSDWFGSMVRVFATLVLLAIGAAFVSESGPHRRDHSVLFADSRDHSSSTVVAGEDAAVPISAKSTDAENVFYPEEILMLPADGVSTVTLISDARVDPFEADASLRKRITEFMRVAVGDSFDADADGWNPPTSWLEKVAKQSYEMQESENGVVLTVKKATIDLSDESLREYHRRFHEDKRSQRTVRAAQAYAGTVLILGGLAIFLRLGTSRRPKRA